MLEDISKLVEIIAGDDSTPTIYVSFITKKKFIMRFLNTKKY